MSENAAKGQGVEQVTASRVSPKGDTPTWPQPTLRADAHDLDIPATVQKVDSCSDADLISTAERSGFELVARLDPPPVLCERCQARMPFTGRRCAKCDAAWKRWLGVSRERVFVASGRRAG